jgi:PAS domain S-box-containing protein
MKIPILNVDDNEAGLYAKSRILKAAGFEVIEAKTGNEALDLVAQAQPSLVLLDVNLPDISGIEVCCRIKSDPATAAVLVLQVSATFVTASDRTRALEGGADAYLTEPVEPQELVANVRALMRLREAEQALRQSEERFRLIANATSDALWDWDLVTHEVWSSERLRPFFGYAPEHVCMDPKWWYAHVHPEDRPRVLAGIRAALENGSSSWSDEYRYARANGSYSYVSDRGYILRDRMGKAIRMLGAMADITERKLAEQEREELLARERTAREQMERANRAKDVFLASVSHELRTPLNAILGWTHVLASGKIDPQMAAKAIATIERNVRLQAQLIDDLLDVSRIVSGKMRLEIQPVDLVTVIHAAIDSMSPAAEAKGIYLDLVLDPEAGQITGDPNRLQQVVWNLLSNAIKFTAEGGHVTVTLERADPFIQITVADTGKGINPEALPYVFDHFWQADSSTKRIHGGLGLGLAIVHHITELHGGQTTADSPGLGRGATFTVRLPVRAVRTALAEEPERVPPMPLITEAAPSLEGLRVLVVDDEPDARELIKTVLEGYGAQVTMAASAAECLAELSRMATSQGLPDVLISDIGMPGEDGYDLIGQVRVLPAEYGGRIPAVALTAYSRAQDQVRVLAAGFQSHVAKPVEPVDLASVVASLRRGWKDRTPV